MTYDKPHVHKLEAGLSSELCFDDKGKSGSSFTAGATFVSVSENRAECSTNVFSQK